MPFQGGGHCLTNFPVEILPPWSYPHGPCTPHGTGHHLPQRQVPHRFAGPQHPAQRRWAHTNCQEGPIKTSTCSSQLGGCSQSRFLLLTMSRCFSAPELSETKSKMLSMPSKLSWKCSTQTVETVETVTCHLPPSCYVFPKFSAFLWHLSSNKKINKPPQSDGLCPSDSGCFPIPHLSPHHTAKLTRLRTKGNPPKGKIPHQLQKETPPR